MTSFDIYVFILCFIVFTLLTSLLTTFLYYIVKYYLKLVEHGIEDSNIIAEHEKMKNAKARRTSRMTCCACTILSIITVAAVLAVFSFSLFLNLTANNKVGDIPVLKVVKSNSMSYKYEANKYLFENDLNDQVNIFDLIVMHKLPQEMDLRQYNIVAYERNGNLILHRIVGIEEPNDEHPDKRYFLLQGDAVQFQDKFPVLYEDMKGIYYGNKIPFVGSFVSFMQSPAGYLCIILILFSMVATPIVNRKIEKAKKLRLDIITDARLLDENKKQIDKHL